MRRGAGIRSGSLCTTFVMLLLGAGVAGCGAASGAEPDSSATAATAGDANAGRATDGQTASAGRGGTAAAAMSGAGPAAASGAGPAAASGAGPAAASGPGPVSSGGGAPAAAGSGAPAAASGGASAAASGGAPAAASGAGPAATSGTNPNTAAAGSNASNPVAANGSAGAPSANGSSSPESPATPAAGAGATQAPAADGGAEPASCKGDQPGNAPVIYVIGDSTASVYESKLYPRMGWAQPLQEYFKMTCATVQDKALSGRSSKSFFDEGAWTPIRSALHEGDFVLIQFGHNDEKSEDATRYTEPFGSYQEHLSTYIDDTLAAKATPILLTSIERNKWSAGKLSSTHGDYPEAVRQLAQKRQLTLVDMTQLTHEYLERIGQDASSKLFMNLAPGESPNYPDGNSDDTHLQDKGAHIVAEIALAELARQRTSVAALLDHVPSPP